MWMLFAWSLEAFWRRDHWSTQSRVQNSFVCMCSWHGKDITSGCHLRNLRFSSESIWPYSSCGQFSLLFCLSEDNALEDFLRFLGSHSSHSQLCISFFSGFLLPSVPCWTFLVAQAVKNLPANAGDQGLIPGWGRAPGEGNSYPLQYSCLKNPMDRGAWQATVHGVAELYMTERLTLCTSLVLPRLFPFCPSFPFFLFFPPLHPTLLHLMFPEGELDKYSRVEGVYVHLSLSVSLARKSEQEPTLAEVRPSKTYKSRSGLAACICVSLNTVIRLSVVFNLWAEKV